MKKLLLFALAFVSISSMAQTEKEIKKEIKKEVKIENTDGKYQVTIITTENGETKTITRSYDSAEEMKLDAELEDMKIVTLHKNWDNVEFTEEGDGEKEMKIIIKKDGDSELHEEIEFSGDEQNAFVFISGEDAGAEMSKIKVWIDEDGEKHISKDGIEIEGNSWTDENGKTYDVDKMDGRVMFKSEGEVNEFITDDGKSVKVNVIVDGDEKEHGTEVFVFESTSEEVEVNGEGRHTVVVKIVEELKLHLVEVEENEFSDTPGIDAKSLKVNELNYFPNPNSGKFTLAFQTTSKPTEIRITGVDGKEVYSEALQQFEGSYNNEIDLSGQKKGIYLLQILQGKKAMNKKIVIE